jgi:hypothetical protein
VRSEGILDDVPAMIEAMDDRNGRRMAPVCLCNVRVEGGDELEGDRVCEICVLTACALCCAM